VRWILVLGLMLVSEPAFAGRSQMTAEETYNLGQRYLKRGYYLKALEQFNRVRTYFRDDPYALKAELAIADMHYQKNEWDAARVAYEDFVRAHPRYPELDYVIYRLGMTSYKKAPVIPDRDQAWTRATVNTWASFSTRFPESVYREDVEKYLKKARDRLARKELKIAIFYEKREAPLAVEGRLVAMLQKYPDSPDVPRALAMLAMAYAQTERVELAKSALDRMESEFPDSRWTTRLKRELARLAP
jgi:outer membrane protein assembly factor BamD